MTFRRNHVLSDLKKLVEEFLPPLSIDLTDPPQRGEIKLITSLVYTSPNMAESARAETPESQTAEPTTLEFQKCCVAPREVQNPQSSTT